MSWICALKEKELFAPLTFNGSCNKDLFKMGLEECLLPKLEKGDIIVIDNASFHKGEDIALRASHAFTHSRIQKYNRSRFRRSSMS